MEWEWNGCHLIPPPLTAHQAFMVIGEAHLLIGEPHLLNVIISTRSSWVDLIGRFYFEFEGIAKLQRKILSLSLSVIHSLGHKKRKRVWIPPQMGEKVGWHFNPAVSCPSFPANLKKIPTS